jgi:uroporphyrinogen decarboxylase
MNGKERVRTALGRGIPDRVPHFELAYNESSVIGIARLFAENVPEPDFIQRMGQLEQVRLFDAAVNVIRELDVDGITMRVFHQAEFVNALDFIDTWGVRFRLDPAGEAVVLHGPIADAYDLKRYEPPEIDPRDFLALGYSIEKLGSDRAVILSLQCPFRRSWNLVGGMTNLLVAYIEEPEFVHRLARIVTDYTKQAIDVGVGMGADVISLDGDLAFNTNTIISPEQFREFLAPYYTELVSYVHGKGLPIFKHSDGDLTRILDDLLATGIDGLHPIQPQCMDMATMKRDYGERICLLGNIDCVKTLVSGSESDVEDEVKRTISIAAPGGGYILSSSNTIHPGVKPENYLAMVRAAHRYGVYPIGTEQPHAEARQE